MAWKTIWHGDNAVGSEIEVAIDRKGTILITDEDVMMQSEMPVRMTEENAVAMARAILKHFGVKEVR